MKDVDDNLRKEQRRIYTKHWNRNNTEAIKRQQKVYRDKLRKEAIEEYGGKCTCCNESTPEFLTLDHIKGRDGDRRRGTSFLVELRRKGWPKDNYRLLCWNCNCGRQLNKGICPHQFEKEINIKIEDGNCQPS